MQHEVSFFPPNGGIVTGPESLGLVKTRAPRS